MHDVKMRLRLKSFVQKVIEDDLPTLAASLAFYSVLSMAPLAVMTIFVLSYLPASVEDFIQQIGLVFGPQASTLAQHLFRQSSETSLRNWAGFGSILLSLIFASAMFAQLQLSLNKIFEIKSQPIHRWILKRLQSMGLVFVLILALFLSSVAMNILVRFKEFETGGIQLLRITLVILSPCLLLYWLPPKKVVFFAAAVGGVITGLLFELGSWTFTLYLERTAVASAYGAMGSLVVFLLWIYYSALILLFGAEIANHLCRGVARKT
jgi:membrane protein